MTVPDKFNTALGVEWNRTYGQTEPQQIHLSFGSDSKYARIQFATLSPIDQAVLKYWPKSRHASASNKPVTQLRGESWTFTDGGALQRELYMHMIKTKNLKAATVYTYQVGATTSNGTQWGPELEFHTGSKEDEFSFLSIGDMGVTNAVSMPHLVDFAKTHKYDFVTLSGDQAYDMADFDGIKGDQYMNMVQELFARVPYMGVPGNHERAYNFSHYINRYATLPHKESHFANPLMYSFDYKSLHLISFSTEIYFYGTNEEVQTAINWLEADLVQANKHRHQRPWIVLITHHPLYCSVVSEDCTSKAQLIRDGFNNTGFGALEPLLLKYNVDVVIAGHVHNYERTLPVAKGQVTCQSYHQPNSYVQVIVGNAGQPEGAESFNTTGPWADWSAKRYGGNGFSTVKVTPQSFSMTHHQANQDGTLGSVIDSFTISK
ncbi:Metallo-dependent phosphatase [Lichtheimia hyalospora FSU 10163]|nr:Metallo-dependent phosphatase [Lichtheimia hyalospora FSU 10163]